MQLIATNTIIVSSNSSNSSQQPRLEVVGSSQQYQYQCRIYAINRTNQEVATSYILLQLTQAYQGSGRNKINICSIARTPLLVLHQITRREKRCCNLVSQLSIYLPPGALFISCCSSFYWALRHFYNRTDIALIWSNSSSVKSSNATPFL